MNEFYNGAYGGSLFCFAFKTDIQGYFDLKEAEKTGKTITIPKGTQYGFFSSFQGACSVFEKTTYRNMTILLKEKELPEYDCIGLKADEAQHYSMTDVYGSNSFVKKQNINIQ